MDNAYLENLIAEVKQRGGGILLSVQEKPEAVVLTLEKYNELVSESASKQISESANKPLSQSSIQETNQSINHPIKHTVLVTGGAGYIGAHVVRQLLKAGAGVVVLDNLSTGRREHVPNEAKFIEGEAGDMNLLRDIFANEHIDFVIHMAASIEVGESVEKPVEYLQNNALNTAVLLKAMEEAGVKNIIFSSTAAVYGKQEAMPIPETAPLDPNNPYAHSKYIAEQLIEYYCKFSGFRAVVFRYFNACGTDYDGVIHSAHESHLIPNVLKVARGEKAHLEVFGNDYETFDGTGVRDYVHVLDIANAHVKALGKISELDPYTVINIGTGKGFSVEQIVNCVSEVLNRIIPMEISPRRPGDAPITIADNTRMKTVLGFALEHSDLETIIKTSWGAKVPERDAEEV